MLLPELSMGASLNLSLTAVLGGVLSLKVLGASKRMLKFMPLLLYMGTTKPYQDWQYSTVFSKQDFQ